MKDPVEYLDVEDLVLNGTDPTEASNDDVYDLVMHGAAHPIDVNELAQRLRAIVATNG